ncbi:MAG: xanthine dehydrogenase family protein molybdopterin-binding subunit [Alphaproteobacteria bacterium]|nr:xanthine dehydrogenase family protein molybdopterin-binding subunit [Alphaproteobacteria bacterium]
MQDNAPPADWSLAKFGIGQPVPRGEDPHLLRGEGRYTDDINLPRQAYAAMVRSPHAHGAIRGIGTEAARSMPGVLAVITGAELKAAGLGMIKPGVSLPNRDGTPMKVPPRPSLTSDRVRHVGDAVACVVAETPMQARDAAEAVSLDIDPLPAVTEARDAATPEAPVLHEGAPGNLALDYHYGDAEKTAAAFAAAAHVVRLPIINNRLVANPIEPRAALAEYDAGSGRWTFHTCSQGVMGMRNNLASDILGAPAEKLRVMTGNVGGSFGMKSAVYPEYACLLHAARVLGRPVKWTDDRSGSFVSDQHGRDHDVTGELALDRDGKFLAVRITGYANMGAYLGNFGLLIGSLNIVKNTVGGYTTPLIEVAMKCVFTNTTPIGPYRGAGRPEGNYYMERLVDAAAAQTGIDRVELRKRNHIRDEQLPYQAASGMLYDSGAFSSLLDRAVGVADWDGFARRQADSRARGRLRGRGIGGYLEVTATGAKEMGGIRFEPDGTVSIVTGTLDYGQGHLTPLAQVMYGKLGIPLDRVRLVQGDSDQLTTGGGTGGSRSITMSGAAVLAASDRVVEQGKAIAAHALEAAVADIEFARGRFSIAGTDRSIGIMELAERLCAGLKLPPDVPPSLDVSLIVDTVPSAFPNGCHVCEVEIDPETGKTDVVRYASVNDFGTIVNPLLVAGQVHGGVVQGIGQALMECARYDGEGQLLTGSFMDYALPRASDSPNIEFVSHPSPAKTNPLGTKGCGEAGCAGALPAVMNAVVDALSVYGIRHIDMPATPERVWQAIQDAKAERRA